MQDIVRDQALQILDSLPVYTAVLGIDRKVLWVNALAARDFGAPNGRVCHELYGVRHGECPDCPVRRTLADGGCHGREFSFRTRDGNRISVMVDTAPLRDASGNIVAVIETAVNITPVKELQKQLILVGQTVAGMTHSIKNIMMGLDGGIYVVNKGLEANDRKEIQEGWEMVLLNFKKISQIVQDILYCSKEREPNLELINPNEIVLEVFNLFRDTAARYSVKIVMELDDDMGEALIDPAGLHTVLSNLVANALDACKMDLWKDEHLIELRTKRRKDGAIVFEVADNGVGIDKGIKEHVFEEFFTSKGDKGTGLGLMVTQKILREHGGSVTFRSRPGHGTTFSAVFPQGKTNAKRRRG
jgi:signal transduction histidine kinase